MSDSYSDRSRSPSAYSDDWVDNLTPIMSDLCVSMNQTVEMLGLIARAVGARQEDVAEVLAARDEVET